MQGKCATLNNDGRFRQGSTTLKHNKDNRENFLALLNYNVQPRINQSIVFTGIFVGHGQYITT